MIYKKGVSKETPFFMLWN